MELGSFDILIPGSYFCDIVFSGSPHFPTLGSEIYYNDLTVVPGGVMNTVIGLSRLNVNVGWVGVVGTDFFSRFILERAAAEGVNTSLLERLDEPFQRVTVSLSYPHDRAFVTYVDPPPSVIEITESILDEVEFRYLHFTGLTLADKVPALLWECRQRGIFCSSDCQYREETIDLPIVQEVLSSQDLFMPNLSEAKRLTHTDTLEDAARVLLEYVPFLIIKDGAAGAHAWKDGKHYHVPALQMPETIDTTGAGDAFNAGFLAAHIAGKDIETCLKWGNICGGLSTQGYGGCSNAPTLEILESYLGKTQP